eukprot:1384483-Amphidinium_carterae.1
MLPLHVCPDQKLVLYHAGHGEGALLVLNNMTAELVAMICIGGPRPHTSPFSACCQHFWACLYSSVLSHIDTEEIQGLDQNAIGSVIFGALVVANE